MATQTNERYASGAPGSGRTSRPPNRTAAGVLHPCLVSHRDAASQHQQMAQASRLPPRPAASRGGHRVGTCPGPPPPPATAAQPGDALLLATGPWPRFSSSTGAAAAQGDVAHHEGDEQRSRHRRALPAAARQDVGDGRPPPGSSPIRRTCGRAAADWPLKGLPIRSSSAPGASPSASGRCRRAIGGERRSRCRAGEPSESTDCLAMRRGWSPRRRLRCALAAGGR